MAALSKLRLTAVSGAQHRGFTTDSSSSSCVRLRRRLGWRCVSGYLGWESRRCSSSRARHGKTPNAARKEARKRPGSRSANGSCPRSILALARRSAGSTVRCFRHQVLLRGCGQSPVSFGIIGHLLFCSVKSCAFYLFIRASAGLREFRQHLQDSGFRLRSHFRR